MFRSISLFSIGALILIASSFACAGEKIDKSLQVENLGAVEVHNVRGEIELVGWSKNVVKVVGTLDDMTEKFIFSTDNGQTIIKIKLPENSSHRNRKGSNLKIMIPENSKLSVFGVATDFKLKNISRGVDVNSISGNVDLSDVKGQTKISNVSGELKLSSLEGNIDISTVSGKLVAQVDSEHVSVTSVSADIELSIKKIKSAKLSSVSGIVKISGILLNDGILNLSNVSGETSYYSNSNSNSDSDLNAEIILNTGPSGKIINQLSGEQPKSTFINSNKLHFTVGSGSAVIRMSTVSGSIGLKKG